MLHWQQYTTRKERRIMVRKPDSITQGKKHIHCSSCRSNTVTPLSMLQNTEYCVCSSKILVSLTDMLTIFLCIFQSNRMQHNQHWDNQQETTVICAVLCVSEADKLLVLL